MRFTAIGKTRGVEASSSQWRSARTGHAGPGMALAAALVALVLDADAAPLPFDERLDAAVALERVADAHRLWTGPAGARPPFEQRVARDVVRRRVEAYLAMSAALEEWFEEPVSAEDLQRELDRIARDTRDSSRLRELLAAIGSDPLVAAECVARRTLAIRRFEARFAVDPRIHAAARRRAEALRDRAVAGDLLSGVELHRYEVSLQDGRLDARGAAVVPNDPRAASFAHMPVGRWGDVEEGASAFVVRRVVDRDARTAFVEAIVVPKVTPEEWLAARAPRPGWREPGTTGAFRSVVPAAGGSEFHEQAPDAAAGLTAVWTGTEMIVWGGNLINDGARYDPATDSWEKIARGTAAPSARSFHTAVWTGTEMIVWGGYDAETYLQLDSGGRYDPATDSWRPTSTSGAPGARYGHTMVWTGSRVIVWGGVGASTFSDGGRYDPVSDSWQPTAQDPSTPAPRSGHTAVWTGSRMVVWGGLSTAGYHRDGGRYDPAADAWLPTATTGAPTGRLDHTAVWTGLVMIVWGGGAGSPLFDDGGRYDPVADSWLPTSTAGAPGPRNLHGAVWTGGVMIVWGGQGNGFMWGDGGRYDPVTDAWQPVTTASAPTGRQLFGVVWTGAEMILWGGTNFTQNCGDGGRYDPLADRWLPVARGEGPGPRYGAASVWTGSELLVWGGGDNVTLLDTGARYEPVTDSWAPLATSGAPAAVIYHSGVWTGSSMIVWGGRDTSTADVAEGGRYDPAADAWSATSTSGAAIGRESHSAEWTGSEMLVWGGYAGATPTNTGGRYDPATDRWAPMATAGAPVGRNLHATAWIAPYLVVWGGQDGSTKLADGGRYDAGADAWLPVAAAGAPSARQQLAGVAAGPTMVVFGGIDLAFNLVRTGGRYDPASDAWLPTTTAGAPSARADASAVWTGREVVIWGGQVDSDWTGGGRYDPLADAWLPTSEVDVPAPRVTHNAVFTGRHMIICCGFGTDAYQSGGAYDSRLDSWSSSGVPPRDHIVAAKATGGSPAYDAVLRGYLLDGSLSGLDVDAFPGSTGAGARPAAGDVDAGGYHELLAGMGPLASNPPRVRGLDVAGAPVPGLDFLAYGAGGFGANVAAGAIDGSTEILTGPGPSQAYGPHVRAFRYAGGVVSSIAKVSFFAYGTLRYGANVASGDVDGDVFEEIVTGAPPGEVFGPHVRGFDVDGVAPSPIVGLSFFAYGTLRYGVNVAAGDVDADGFAEIATGPGPSPAFGAQLRGFDHDGAGVAAAPGLDAFVFPSRHGLEVATGDLDADGRAEIAAGAGPDAAFGSRMRAFGYDGARLLPIPALDLDAFGLSYGVRVATGGLGL